MPDNRMEGDEGAGGLQSPSGNVFGVIGWVWAEPRPKTITFFLDGTAMVCDQYGRPIRGTTVDNVQVRFALRPPQNDDPPSVRAKLASHQQVISALAGENINWKKLTCAGWPQITYEELVKLDEIPPTPLEELKKIANPSLRRDALRARREVDAQLAKELQAVEEE